MKHKTRKNRVERSNRISHPSHRTKQETGDEVNQKQTKEIAGMTSSCRCHINNDRKDASEEYYFDDDGESFVISCDDEGSLHESERRGECTGDLVEWRRPSQSSVSPFILSSLSSSSLSSLLSSSSSSLSSHPVGSSIFKDGDRGPHMRKCGRDDLVRLRAVRTRAAATEEYYSESYLRGVPSVIARIAERDTRERHDLWWRRRQAHYNSAEKESAWDNLGDAAVTASVVLDNKAAHCSNLSPSSLCNSSISSEKQAYSNDDCDYEEEEEELFLLGSITPPVNDDESRSAAAKPLSRDNKKRGRNDKEPSTTLAGEEDRPKDTGSKMHGSVRVRDNSCDTGDQEWSPEEGATTIHRGSGILDDNALDPVRVLHLSHLIDEFKTDITLALNSGGGDTTCPSFLSALRKLLDLSRSSGLNASNHAVAGSRALEGTWLTLSRPNYHNTLGLNSANEYMYSLGRMSFDMFRPSELRCSVQGVFGQSRRVDRRDGFGDGFSVPRGSRRELKDGETALKTYK